jgi:hypothetical protein
LYMVGNFKNVSSFISADNKVFLTSIGEKDMVILVQDFETGKVLNKIICPRANNITLKNSDIINESTGLNYWTGKEEKRNKEVVKDEDLWSAMLSDGITLLAYPYKGGYDLTIGNYIDRKGQAEDNVVIASVLFGAVGGAIANANNKATVSYFFYSRLNDTGQHQQETKMPNNFEKSLQMFDFNKEYKYRTPFKMNGKDYFTVYHLETKHIIIVADE